MTASERRALTTWRAQGKVQVRTAEESEQKSVTHILESTGEVQVKTAKDSERVRDTHCLGSAEGRKN